MFLIVITLYTLDAVFQKTRSDNKYYKVMSDVEAKETERAFAQKQREKLLSSFDAITENAKKATAATVSIFYPIHTPQCIDH